MHRFSLICDAHGNWTVTGTTGTKPLCFRDLPAAVEFARQEACGREADIELWAEGLYMFVHQTKGWPHCLYARAQGRRTATMTANARSPVTSMNPGAGAVAPRQHPRASLAKASPRTTVYQYLGAGFEGLILVALFLVLAATALYLRARSASLCDRVHYGARDDKPCPTAMPSTTSFQYRPERSRPLARRRPRQAGWRDLSHQEGCRTVRHVRDRWG
jgi:hypothetical protein